MITEIIIDENLKMSGNLDTEYCIEGMGMNDFNAAKVYTCDADGHPLSSVLKYTSYVQIYISDHIVKEIELYSGHSESAYVDICRPIKTMKVKLEGNYVLAIYLIY